MARVYNFSSWTGSTSGRSVKRSRRGMLDYRGCGMSVMEMSHRSKMSDDHQPQKQT